MTAFPSAESDATKWSNSFLKTKCSFSAGSQPDSERCFCLSTRWMPARLRRFLERIDRAAVYKHWARKSPATLGPERTSALARMNRLRPLWVLRGYIGARRDDRRRG